MKKYFKPLAVAFIIVFAIASCDKFDYYEGNPGTPFEYTSLDASQTTIKRGESIQLIANAKGYKLKYKWSVAYGDIEGGGSKVTFVSTNCRYGPQYISCTVEDGNGASEYKAILINIEDK